ncbi:MAG: UDP-N-acetylglucosamine--N-acetylmuramyl-(pentapeptide) pyrophosphoryl-undecaprenol N-acetylglucosamine transferase [Vulcanimicrobiaceae bacterium]
MRVLFTGGGTGGHLYPAIAIAQALAADTEILFVGTRDRMEAEIIPEAGYRIAFVSAKPLVRRFSFEVLASFWASAVGIVQSLRVVRRFRPDIVIATGGYVCFPVVVAVWIRRLLHLGRCAIALVEPNAQPGITTRALIPLCDEVWGAFAPPSAKHFVKTGVPIRASVRMLPSRNEALERLGMSGYRNTLLVVGGSLGARKINDAILGLVRAHGVPDGWQIMLVTGKTDFERVNTALHTTTSVRGVPYLADIADAYAAADLVLARSGASTLAELAMAALPAILVPYPHAADDHQTANAVAFATSGAAVVLPDAECTAQGLGAVLERLLFEGEFAKMQTAARRSAPADPLGSILARIDALRGRTGASR